MEFVYSHMPESWEGDTMLLLLVVQIRYTNTTRVMEGGEYKIVSILGWNLYNGW
jgi:hypothetical protein